MKLLIFVFLFLGLTSAANAKTYGEDFTAEKTSSLTEVLAKADEYTKKDVVIQAKVDKVCQSKGCWFEVKPKGAEPTKVVFKDYAFFVPKDIGGKTVTMKGRLKQKKMSVKEQRHYLKDAGASKAEIKAIKEPKSVYQFVASGVKI